MNYTHDIKDIYCYSCKGKINPRPFNDININCNLCFTNNNKHFICKFCNKQFHIDKINDICSYRI